MATVTVYGPTVNHWRSWLSYELSDGPDYIDVTVRAGPEAVAWGFNIKSVTTYVKCTQWRNEVSYTGNFYSPAGGNGYATHINQTFRIAKDHDTWHPTISFRCVNSSGYMNGTSSSSTTFTMGPKTSYTVAYNANGGSGAPGNQTKWYGETLSLSATRPTRPNHTFLGWATSANGSVAYQPGANYTSNSGVTLYAIWKLAYIPPTLSNFTAQRCTSSGTISDSGTYIKVTANYKADTSSNSSNKITEINVQLIGDAVSIEPPSNPNAASGTFTQIVGRGSVSTTRSYTVILTIKDSNGQSTQQSTVVSAAFALMDIDGANKGIAFGRSCPGTGVYIDTTGKIDFNGLTLSNGKSNMAQQIRNAIGAQAAGSYVTSDGARRSALTSRSGAGVISDLNNAKYGVYEFNTSTANRPVDYGCCLCFCTWPDQAPGTNGQWIFQIAFGTTNYLYARCRINTGAWQSWWTIAWK